jgi:hypothetical protein
LRIGIFEEATLATGHHWHCCDLTNAFADWLLQPANASFAQSYFEAPELLDEGPLGEFQDMVARQLIETMQALPDPDNTVVATMGVASLFGFARVSQVLPLVEPHIRGRLLVFFPGVYENNNYRILDARDGWNYLAIPITSHEGEPRP